MEEEYNIIINEGYFGYILSEEEKDEETIEYCKNNELYYVLFSIKILEFIGLNQYESIFNKKSFITNVFPYLNSFSILSRNNFNIKNKKLENYDYIKKIQDQLRVEEVPEETQAHLKKYFKVPQSLYL